MSDLFRRLPSWLGPLSAALLALMLTGAKGWYRFSLPDQDVAGDLPEEWATEGRHPALAAAGQHGADTTGLSAERIVALSRASQFLGLRLWLANEMTGQDIPPAHVDDFVSILLDPKNKQVLVDRCPILPEYLELLCDEEARQQLENAVDRLLGRTLSQSYSVAAEHRQDETDLGLLSAEVASGLGVRGVKMAETVLLSSDASPRSRSLAVTVLARALPPERAEERMLELLRAEEPAVVVVALELARLDSGRSKDKLSAVADELGGDVRGQLVRFAVSGLLADQP